MTPTDKFAYYGTPELDVPNIHFKKILISCSFTWDIEKAQRLAYQWEPYGPVQIGGPAFGDHGEEFEPGLFLKKGVVITSRGCPASCSWCFVPGREGKIRELNIGEGNIVQDNNLLACSRNHIEKVFSMLKKQKEVDFPGGVDVLRLKDWHIELLRGIKLYQVWVAFDSDQKKEVFRFAVERLRKYFKIRQVRAYVLIGYEGDTIEKAEERLRFAFEVGALPFAMHYRTNSGDKAGSYLYSTPEWNKLRHDWTRKESIFGIMKNRRGVGADSCTLPNPLLSPYAPAITERKTL